MVWTPESCRLLRREVINIVSPSLQAPTQAKSLRRHVTSCMPSTVAAHWWLCGPAWSPATRKRTPPTSQRKRSRWRRVRFKNKNKSKQRTRQWVKKKGLFNFLHLDLKRIHAKKKKTPALTAYATTRSKKGIKTLSCCTNVYMFPLALKLSRVTILNVCS